MPVFEVSIAVSGQPIETVTVRDERDLEKLSIALVENGFVASEEVRVIRAGVEYEGRTNEYSAIEPVGEIALFANDVLFIRQLELPTEH